MGITYIKHSKVLYLLILNLSYPSIYVVSESLYIGVVMDVRLQQVIEQYKDKNQQIRLFYMDDDGTDWLEEGGCIGCVVYPQGAVSAHDFELANTASVLHNAIGKVVDVQTGRVLYQHGNYQNPNLVVFGSHLHGWAVKTTDGRVVGFYRNKASATRLANYLNGVTNAI